MRRAICVLIAALVCQVAMVLAADSLPVEIKPSDPKLYYIGRFDTSDSAGPQFTWSHSMVKLRFRGTDLQAKIKEEQRGWYQIIVDGKEMPVVHATTGTAVYDVVRGLADGEHEVQIVRRAEAMAGVGQFQGFYLNQGGALLETPRYTRKIEVLGDSITCGYGNEAASESEKFKLEQENAYWTYGAIAAREVGAEYIAVSWSGKKLWPNNTLPELYDRTIASNQGSRWDFTKWQPDAVVINLATNDFGGGNPDEVQWTTAYKQFIRRVRRNYPDAMIYMASGSMMSDNWPPEVKALSTLKGYLTRIAADLKAEGEKKIGVIHFETQNKDVDGIGADWHPNINTHKKMGAVLAERLKRDLGW